MRSGPDPPTGWSWSAPGSAGSPARCTWPAPGREVTVVEREPVPGGRAGRLSRATGTSSTPGPTVLTMPELIAEALGRGRRGAGRLAGADPARPGLPGPLPGRLHAGRASPTRTGWPPRSPGSAAPREADGYLRFVDVRPASCGGWSGADFIERNLDSPVDLLTAQPAAAPRGRRLPPAPDQDQPVLPRSRVPGGSSPSRPCTPASPRTTRSPSTRSSPTWTRSAGVYFPRGGMHAVPRALAGAAEKHGVRFRYDTTVARVETAAGRATGVLTADGERIPADVVVLNPDLPVAYRDLLPGPAGRPAPAALLAVLRGAARRLHARRTRRSPTTTSTSDGPGGAPSTR